MKNKEYVVFKDNCDGSYKVSDQLHFPWGKVKIFQSYQEAREHADEEQKKEDEFKKLVEERKNNIFSKSILEIWKKEEDEFEKHKSVFDNFKSCIKSALMMHCPELHLSGYVVESVYLVAEDWAGEHRGKICVELNDDYDGNYEKVYIDDPDLFLESVKKKVELFEFEKKLT